MFSRFVRLLIAAPLTTEPSGGHAEYVSKLGVACNVLCIHCVMPKCWCHTHFPCCKLHAIFGLLGGSQSGGSLTPIPPPTDILTTGHVISQHANFLGSWWTCKIEGCMGGSTCWAKLHKKACNLTASPVVTKTPHAVEDASMCMPTSNIPAYLPPC